METMPLTVLDRLQHISVRVGKAMRTRSRAEEQEIWAGVSVECQRLLADYGIALEPGNPPSWLDAAELQFPDSSEDDREDITINTHQSVPRGKAPVVTTAGRSASAGGGGSPQGTEDPQVESECA